MCPSVRVTLTDIMRIMRIQIVENAVGTNVPSQGHAYRHYENPDCRECSRDECAQSGSRLQT